MSIDRKHIFSEYFASGSGLEFAKGQALAGTLQHSPLRSLCWRLFLNIIPEGTNASAWKDIIHEQRVTYNQLKEEYLVNPYEETSENLEMNNPLSQVEDSPWQTFFQNKELQNEILQDVIRTHPENEFFQKESVRTMMLHILFIVAKRNPSTGYRQGMHELLAPIIYLLHKESISPSEVLYVYCEEDHVAFTVSSSEFIEHDAFILFDKLMVHMDKWFMRTNPGGSGNSDTQSSPIVQKSKQIQDVLLKKLDPILQAFLTDMNVEPQIYALRWIRLLFGREFHLDDVLVVWDAIFAYGEDLKLMDYICLAMIHYLRDQLLEMDNSGVLRRLLHYPPVEDVTIFITSALAHIDPQRNVRSKKRVPEPVSANIEELFVPVKSTAPMRVPTDPVGKLRYQLKQSTDTRQHMAKRLDRIIYIFQQSVQHDSPIDTETLIGTVAELKQVKDILNGLLDEVPLN